MAPGSGSSRKKTKHGQGPYATIKTKNEDLPVFRQLNDMDVLCGRGNGINMRKGNREFRTHVDNLRTAYVAAQRQEKVDIARRVVELVSINGGRFVKHKNSPNEEVYVEIGLERAVEKACQALREGCGKKKQEVRKMKRDMAKSTAERSSSSRTKDKNKTKVPKKKRNAGAKQKGQSKSSLWQGPHHHSGGNGATHSHGTFEEDSFLDNTETPGMDYSTDSDSMGGDTDGEYPDATRYYNRYHQPRSSGIAEDKYNDASSQRPPTHRLMMADSSPPGNTDPSNTDQPEASGWFCDYMNGATSDALGNASLDWETLFRSLVQWKEVHGHCAIPPSAGIPQADSSREEKEQARLADWASVQRQIFREIHKGRREPTDEENIRFRRLQALGFVWDYEEWHWNRNYEELMKLQDQEEARKNAKSADGDVGTESNGDKKSGTTRADFSKRLRLALWVNDQRRLYMDGVRGTIHQMRADRVEKLEKVDFSWAEDIQLRGIADEIDSKQPSIVTSDKKSTAITPSSAITVRTAVVSPDTPAGKVVAAQESDADTASAPVTRDENGSRSPEPSSDGEIWRGAPDEPIEGGWPKGWTKKVYERKSGATKGDTDKYWFSPKKQYKFRSMKQVQRYLGFLQKVGLSEEDEVTAWEMFRRNMK